MRPLALTMGAFLVLAAPSAPAAAGNNRFERSLKMLGPIDRLEQLCGYTAMQRIRKEHKKFRPDRAVAGNAPRIKDDTIEAEQGAFRSRKKWYALSYKCTAAPDHLSVVEFTYSIGDEIPEEKWASHGLWQ